MTGASRRGFLWPLVLVGFLCPRGLRGEAAGQTVARTVDRIEVRVTASSGGSVFLDQGRAAGIQPGDEVLLYAPGAGMVRGTIQDVSTNHSRCVVAYQAMSVDIGTRGEVLVPADRRWRPDREGSGPPPEATGRPVPEHPPWTHPPEQWDWETPLLAPAFSREASERERQMHGRVFADYSHTWNMRDPQDQYSLGRIGTSLWIENPLRRGGRFHLDGELNRRDLFLDDAAGEVDQPGRIDRFSYQWGGDRDQPFRVEFGRFLQSEIPELGVLDGAEFVYRTESADRIGVSLGAMPEPFPDLRTGDDLQAALFYRFVSGEEENFSAAVAYQKTWHRGKSDRDLVVGTLDYFSPGGMLSLHQSVWGDFYDSSDNLKTRSFEITQAETSGIIRLNPGRGIGVHFSQLRWPQLLRNEHLPSFDDQTRNDWVRRYGLSAWQEWGETVRLDGRVDHWQDQDLREGTTWDLRLALRDLLYERGEVALSIYDTDGAFTSGLGGRIGLNRYFSRGFVAVAYDVGGYRFTAKPGDAMQHGFHATLDYDLSSTTSASLSTDYWLGEKQNSFGLGLFLQKRF